MILRVTGPGATLTGPSALGSLLHWFQRGQELVRGLEGPVPCLDHFGFLQQQRGGRLWEQEAPGGFWGLTEDVDVFHTWTV